MKAVVFAYHDVGVRCLAAMLARGVDVSLVVTHRDNPQETIWFASVAELAARNGIPVIAPENPNAPDVVAHIRSAHPDFLFSFYYRAMLGAELLEIPVKGALNMHGSLLPKYRGRVPINWAIIRGESETGATLHYMLAKPDAGPIVDQMSVPILPDDTALDVFRKVTCAGEIVLYRSLPGLLSGTAAAREQNLAEGNYFGGRKPEDGVVHWQKRAKEIHDLVRAVAPPYPGAWASLNGQRVKLNRTRLRPEVLAVSAMGSLFVHESRLFVTAGDGQSLQLLDLELEDESGNALEVLARSASERSLRFDLQQ
jgi:methionyl-tRNA formyltransferase